VERTHRWDLPASLGERVPVLAAYEAGVTAICELAARFGDADWGAATPCSEWRAFELAAHLRCVADNFHEYLDDAPVSRYARLMATGAHPDTLGRKLARQNAAGLAVLPDAPPAEHIAAFADSARRYAARLGPVWDLPHHQYRDAVVTVGGMAGAACAEWHLHAWDLAQARGLDYRPGDPAAVLAGWLAGMPHLPAVPGAAVLVGAIPSGSPSAGALSGRALPGGRTARHVDPWHAVLAASGRSAFGQAPWQRTAGHWLSWAAWTARLRRRQERGRAREGRLA
jgi:hypothetical protein